MGRTRSQVDAGLSPSRLHPDRPLPRMLDPFTLRFTAEQASDG